MKGKQELEKDNEKNKERMGAKEKEKNLMEEREINQKLWEGDGIGTRQKQEILVKKNMDGVEGLERRGRDGSKMEFDEKEMQASFRPWKGGGKIVARWKG